MAVFAIFLLILHPAFAQINSKWFGNEHHPQIAAPILEKSPSGLILTTSTERALFELIQHSGPTGLVVADKEPEVGLFHFINRELILQSKTRQIYLKRRFADSMSAWDQVHLDRKLFSFWQMLAPALRMIQRVPSLDQESRFEEQFYTGVNYVEDDLAYDLLRQRLMEVSFRFVELDYTRPEEAAIRITEVAKALGDKISLADFSNIFSGFSYPTNLSRLMKDLAPVLHPDAIALFTVMPSSAFVGRWNYISAPAAEIQNQQKIMDFFEFADTSLTSLGNNKAFFVTAENLGPILEIKRQHKVDFFERMEKIRPLMERLEVKLSLCGDHFIARKYR